MLPNDFPPGKVCLITSGNGRKVVFGRGLMNSPVRKLENQAEGRKARTRMIDSQAVKRQKKGAHYDAGQKIKARKGHLLVDRLGLIEAYQSKLRTDQIQMVPNGGHQK